MANRPVYVPKTNSKLPGVDIYDVDFKWHPGMSKSQKQKSILSLHESAQNQGISSILEISSKSDVELGINLSAFIPTGSE